MKTKTNKPVSVTPEPVNAASASLVARHVSAILSHAVVIAIAVLWLTSAARPAVDAIGVVLVSV